MPLRAYGGYDTDDRATDVYDAVLRLRGLRRLRVLRTRDTRWRWVAGLAAIVLLVAVVAIVVAYVRDGNTRPVATPPAESCPAGRITVHHPAHRHRDGAADGVAPRRRLRCPPRRSCR